MVYLLGSWLPTVIKEAGMSVTEATMITALYQAGGTFGSLFAGWLMDRVNPHLALGMIYAAGGVATAMIGVTHAYFVILAVVAFSSGFCLNGANTGMNALSARYYPFPPVTTRRKPAPPAQAGCMALAEWAPS
ncbi:MFS transporter [Dickeya fangzhongdai]